MTIEHYEYLLLELEARTREQQKDFLKSIIERKRKQTLKDVLKIIDDNIKYLKDKKNLQPSDKVNKLNHIRYYLRDKLKAQIEKELGVGEWNKDI